MSAVKVYQKKTVAEHFDWNERNYLTDETITILKQVIPLRESLCHFSLIRLSTEAQKRCFPACCLYSCCSRSQGEPLEHQTGFHVSFILNGSVCTTPGIWSLPLLTALGEFPYNLTSPASPPHAALGYQSPHPESPRGEARRRLLWAKESEGATQGDREGRGAPVPSRSLSGTNEIHIRCSVIKKQMSQCRAVFRRLALQLQMAHSRRSHQPPLHSHIPPFRNTHTHTQTQRKAHTQLSLVSPSGSEKRPRLKCFPVEVTT